MVVQFSDGRIVTVDAGTQTDFASSRVGRWDFLSIEATDSWAAVVHDALYQTALVSRLFADRYFHDGLRTDPDVKPYDAWKGFWGVRVFGWHAWNAHRRASRGVNSGKTQP